MRLGSGDGSAIHLSVLGYQYSARASKVAERDWDANWLTVRGAVAPADHAEWSFTDACLTTFEARELADWLGAVAHGEVVPSHFDTESMEGLLWFTEPALAFSVADRTAEHVVIRVHLSLEALPHAPQERPDLFEHYLEVRMTPSELAVAVEDWRRELSAYPVR